MTVGNDAFGAGPLGEGTSDVPVATPAKTAAYLRGGYGSFAYLAEITETFPRGVPRMANRSNNSSPASAGDDYQTGPWQLVDENANDIDPTTVTAMTLTLYDVATQAIVNGVDHANILNAGRGLLNSEGVLYMSLLPADNVILDPALNNEQHVALVEWTYAGGQKKASHEVVFFVRRVPNHS